MADKPAENLVYEFLFEQKDFFLATGEVYGDADFEIKPSAYDKREKNNGIEIGDADSSMLPNGRDDEDGELEMVEYDALLTIEIFGRVTGKDKTLRLPARAKVFDIKKKLLQLFEKFPTLNGRGCRVKVLRQMRFFDDSRADKYAIERVPIVINPKDLKGE
jgi:hypothetical protein